MCSYISPPDTAGSMSWTPASPNASALAGSPDLPSLPSTNQPDPIPPGLLLDILPTSWHSIMLKLSPDSPAPGGGGMTSDMSQARGPGFHGERQARGHESHPVGPLGDPHVQPALGIAEGTAERRFGHQAQAHFVADENHRRSAVVERLQQRVGGLVEIGADLHQVGKPEGQAIDQHRLAVRLGAVQRLRTLYRLLDGGPADAAARAMGHDAGRHLDAARLGGGDVDRRPR